MTRIIELVALAVGLALAQALVDWDPAKVTDWHAWGVSLLGVAVRAGAGALVGFLAGLTTKQGDRA